MALRDQFTEQLKIAMKAGDAPRVSTLRMIMAKLKDTDIAARPSAGEGAGRARSWRCCAA